MMDNSKIYLCLSDYLRQTHGQKVWKIPLDAGFGCPNRDGTLAKGGCVFCNPLGSGSGLLARGMGIAEQWEHWRARFSAKRKAKLFLAYLQAFSNTHAPLERIESLLKEVSSLPDLAGLALGTRPDCLDGGRLEALAESPAPLAWLELGLQSARDETLLRINRGHDSACFANAVKRAHKLGIKVCAHLVAGLPGEGLEDFLYSVRFISGLPVWGVKFHNLFVAKGSGLQAWLERGEYQPISREAYVEWICQALSRLRPDIVVHRLNADPKPGELLAPQWALYKNNILMDILDNLSNCGLRQGALHHSE